MEHLGAGSDVLVVAFQVVVQGRSSLLKLLGEPLGFGGQVTSSPQPHDEVDDAGIVTFFDFAGVRAVGVRANRACGSLLRPFARGEGLAGLADVVLCRVHLGD
jgi:hypothetical protein